MKRPAHQRYDLDNETSIAERPDGLYTLLPDESVVRVSIADGIATLTTTDDPPEHLGGFRIVTGNGKAAVGAGASRKSDRRPPSSAKPADGRWAMLNAFVDGPMGSLSPAAVCVWLCLFRDTKADGLARTGKTDLARRSSCDRSTVTRAIRSLIDQGRLTIVRRGGIGRGPSAYRVK
jgi:hypothetical protein